jgi:hypothetical protein
MRKKCCRINMLGGGRGNVPSRSVKFIYGVFERLTNLSAQLKIRLIKKIGF